ncbi:MAG: 4-hydroxyphenylacetate 3-hydroxylase N-terminal domain-containing protein, partial [Halieaceae bacterium]
MLMKAGGRIMSAAEYQESLREYSPVVYVDGDRVESVVDEPRLQPGIRAIGVTYDFAQRPEYGGLMLAEQGTSGKTV